MDIRHKLGNWLFAVRLIATAAWQGHTSWAKELWKANRVRLLVTLVPLLLFTFCAGKAWPATVTEGPWTLYRGTAIAQPRVDYPTLAACAAAADRLEPRTYTCRTIATVVVSAPVPVDCEVSRWSAWQPGQWSACSAGTQTRTETRSRTVARQPANGGQSCPVLSETRQVSQPCSPPPVNCAVSSWSAWAASSPGVESRTRSVITPAANGGTACPHLREDRPVTETPPGMPNMPGMPTINTALIPAPAAGSGQLRVRPTDRRHGTRDGPTYNGDGQFRFECSFSHMAFDDPIVYPGQQGAAHLHMFWGNTGAKFSSTTESLMTSGNGTCEGGIANRTSYWMPAMIDTANGRPLKPSTIIIYYKTHQHTRITDYVAPPTGLRMVVGKKQADWAKPADSDTLIRFYCTVDWGASDYDEVIPRNCNGGPETRLQVMIGFYGCWDGKNLDSPDHRSHMAHARNGRCPASHPVPIPEITQNVFYDVPPGTNTSKWRLSSDAYSTSEPGGYSMHADVWLAWNEQVAATWTQRCMRDGYDCHGQLLGDDTELY